MGTLESFLLGCRGMGKAGCPASGDTGPAPHPYTHLHRTRPVPGVPGRRQPRQQDQQGQQDHGPQRAHHACARLPLRASSLALRVSHRETQRMPGRPGRLKTKPSPGRHTCARIPGHTASPSARQATGPAPPPPSPAPASNPHPSACPGPGVRLLPRSPPPHHLCAHVPGLGLHALSRSLTPALGRRPLEPGHLPHTSCMQTLTLQQRQEVPWVTWPRRALPQHCSTG